MYNAQFGRKIRADFIRDQLRPSAACPKSKTEGALYNRRWDARSADACLKQWMKVRRFKAAWDRLNCMSLTGNLVPDDMDRCAQLLHSDGFSSISCPCDFIRNDKYAIAKPFPFVNAYHYMYTHTPILRASGVRCNRAASRGNLDGEKSERPIGANAAQKQK